MDNRAAKLALARKKLKDHQDKKIGSFQTPKLAAEHNIDTYYISENVVSSNIDSEHNMKNTSKTGTQMEQETAIGLELVEATRNGTLQVQPDNIKATEILISNKRNLEIEINALQNKLAEIESNYSLIIEKYNAATKKIQNLENDLKITNDKFLNATNTLIEKDTIIEKLESAKATLTEENNSILEQLEFTKTILTNKESENNSIYSQIFNLQNQLDASLLQLQQLTNGASDIDSKNEQINTEENTYLIQKIASTEQQLRDLHKEKDSITLHYQHYVNDLNEQLKNVLKKNEEQQKEIKALLDREGSLIELVAEMEVKIQNLSKPSNVSDSGRTNTSDDVKELQRKYDSLHENYNEIVLKHDQLQKQYAATSAKVIELSQPKESVCQHDEISMSKLNADITSDKIAAQRATEQNKKLKNDIQGLEEAFVKMSRDKLELMEKLTAEKDLNRKLTISLADVEEKANDMQKKLKAKDEEMIRLQLSYRDMENKYEHLLRDRKVENNVSDNTINDKTIDNVMPNEDCMELSNDKNCSTVINDHDVDVKRFEESSNKKENIYIPKEDAMEKLQRRFFKKMEELASLSDEKHKLEHIILQLQNETETICEYVALYQQQRSLLKKRDEERSAQVKMFQEECNKLRTQLEELTTILAKLAEDKDLTSYFEMDSRRNDIKRVASLLSNLKNNSLVDPNKNIEFKNFNPCNCCSGKLIEI